MTTDPRLAEEAVIGAMLIAPTACGQAVELLEPAAFHHPPHQLIFGACLAVFERGEPVDVVTIDHELQAAGHSKRTGGIDELTRLALGTPTTAHVDRYAAIVNEAATRRRLVGAAAEATQAATSEPRLGAALANAADAVLGVVDSERSATTEHVRDNLHALLDFIETGAPDGIGTGLPALDDVLRGLQPANFVLVGARPAMGKTALAVGIALHAAIEENQAVLFASLEMSPHEVGCRLVANHAKLDLQRLIRGEVAPSDMAKFGDTLARLNDSQLYLDDDAGLTIGALTARARRLKARHGLGLIVVDYLQLMVGRSNSDNRQVEVAEISRGLKRLARELEVPVVAMAQLNRDLEGRTDKRPLLADLRESGSLEQDADVVLFLYRDEVYNPDSPDRGVVELRVAKHRNGPPDTVRAVWLPWCAKFVPGTPKSADDH